MHENKNKINAYKIINELYKDKNSVSVTLTGSYSEHFNLNKAGDIDIIIVCKKLTKKYFENCIQKLKKIKKKLFKDDFELIINSTFGPIKFYKKNSVVFHLMIYDLKSHIDHTIKSPFTCYDWERSNVYVGKSLKELSPVLKLQLRDFYEARRSTQEYLKDISNNQISFREYKFSDKNISLQKKYFKIDEINKRDFIYHTIKFLLVNYIKYENNLNIKVSETKIDRKFYEIVKNISLLKKFKELRKLKNYKSKKNIENPKKLAIVFIEKFNSFIKNKITNSNKIYFVRHKKTTYKKEIFLGQKMDPNILERNKTKEFNNIKFNKYLASPAKRCIETAKIFTNSSKISINNNLKEINYGKAEGLTLKNLEKKYPQIIASWLKAKDPKFPDGENTRDVLKRVNNFIKYLNRINNKNTKIKVLVITHNVFLRCLIGSSFNINLSQWFNINLNYFELLEFTYDKNKLRININRNKFLNIFSKFYIKN